MDRAEISNSEPSAIVLHAIPCIGGLYISFDSNGENGALQIRARIRRKDSPTTFAAIHPFQIPRGHPHREAAFRRRRSLSLIISLISAAGRISIVPHCNFTPGDWEMS